MLLSRIFKNLSLKENMLLTTEDIRRTINVFQECYQLLDACCDPMQVIALFAVSLEPTVNKLLLFDNAKQLYPKMTSYDEVLGEISQDLPVVEFVTYGLEVLQRINTLAKSMEDYWADIKSSVFKSRMQMTDLQKLLNGENSTSQDTNWNKVFQNLLDSMLAINSKIFIFLNVNKELMKIAEKFLNNIMLV